MRMSVSRNFVFQLKEWQFAVLLTILYAAAVIFLSSFHEVWRDEVVPLTIVSESRSPAEVLANLRNYGHPALWHFLLFGVYKVFQNPLVLPALNILVCVAAVFIFLRYAPFSRLEKILFPLGAMPLYFYPVINRSYGLAMLLIFALCTLYSRRHQRPVVFGILLALLFNTHPFAFLVAAAFCVSLGWEAVFEREPEIRVRAQGFVALIPAAMGALLAAWQMVPDHDSFVFSREALQMSTVFSVFVRALLVPGKYFADALGFESSLYVAAVIFSLYACLARKRPLLIFVLAGVVALNLFAGLVYPAPLKQHRSFLFLLVIAVCWLDQITTPDERTFSWLKNLSECVRPFVRPLLVFIFLQQICIAYPHVLKEIKLPYSHGKNLTAFLKSDPRLKQAILIGEPGGLMETLPYYAPNDIYMWREGRFARYAKLTSESKREASLAEFLAEAHKVRAKSDRPVVLVIGHRLSPDGPFDLTFTYDQAFRYSAESFQDFVAATEPLVSLRGAVTDEEYDVYLLR